jgi:hypothetical protein
MPQSKPCCVQLIGVQPMLVPQTFGVMAPQVCPGGQVAPQSSVPPQPSLAWPQSKPWSWQVCGVHSMVHAPFKQAWLGGQVPQSMTLPQPSAWKPHVKPCC